MLCELTANEIDSPQQLNSCCLNTHNNSWRCQWNTRHKKYTHNRIYAYYRPGRLWRMKSRLTHRATAHSKRVNIKISRTLCPIFYSHSSSSISINGQCNFFKFSFLHCNKLVGCWLYSRPQAFEFTNIRAYFVYMRKTWMEVLNFTFHLCCVCFHYLQTFFILFSMLTIVAASKNSQPVGVDSSSWKEEIELQPQKI